MARIRSIKPEFWTSTQVMECSPTARLLFIGLWNFCDDRGRHPLAPKRIKAEIFPGDDFTSENILGMIDELSRNGLISIYAVDGVEFFHITGWRHQKIDKPQDPKYPGPEKANSSNARRLVATDRIGKDTKVEEGKGKKENPTPPTSSGTAREGGGEDSKGEEDQKKQDAAWTALCKSIVRAYEDANSTALPDTGWVDIWRGRGYDPAMCLTIVKAGVKAKPSIGTLKYFDNQLEQEHAKITTARKQSEGLAPKKDEFDWHPIMRVFVGTSPRTWIHPSPRPGLVSCIVPRDILEQYLPDMYPPRKPKEPRDAEPPSGAHPDPNRDGAQPVLTGHSPIH